MKRRNKNGVEKLRVPELRVLQALMPECLDDSPMDWPLINRVQLGIRAGYTATSGTINRAFYGIQSRKSGTPHPGLIDRGLIECEVLDIDGVDENNYRITQKGVDAYVAHVEEYGGELPTMRDPLTYTNNRYMEVSEEELMKNSAKGKFSS